MATLSVATSGTSSGFCTASIGKKYLMGITGLGLSLFVLTHMLGNVLLFVSAEAYNQYSHALISNKLIYVAELGLLALFIIHLGLGLRLTIENKLARGQRFNLTTNGAKSVSLASKTMIYHGVVLGVFTVHHLLTFKFGPHYDVNYGGVAMRDIHKLVLEVFQSPAYVAWYTFAMCALWIHLHHGFQSTFQSLGFNQPRYTPVIRKIGYAYAAIVALGFISQPLYVFLYSNQ